MSDSSSETNDSALSDVSEELETSTSRKMEPVKENVISLASVADNSSLDSSSHVQATGETEDPPIVEEENRIETTQNLDTMACPDHRRNKDMCNSIIACPYNKGHHVGPFAFNSHILACRRQHLEHAGDVKLVKCPHNPNHYIPVPELKLHSAFCDDSTFAYLLKQPLIRLDGCEIVNNRRRDSSSENEDGHSHRYAHSSSSSSSSEPTDSSISDLDSDSDECDEHASQKFNVRGFLYHRYLYLGQDRGSNDVYDLDV